MRVPLGVIEAKTSVKFCRGFAHAGVSLQIYLRASLGGTVFLTRDGPGLSMGRTSRGGEAGKILGEVRAWTLSRFPTLPSVYGTWTHRVLCQRY